MKAIIREGNAKAIAEARDASPTVAVAADGTLYVGYIRDEVEIFAYRDGRFQREPPLKLDFKPDLIRLVTTKAGLFVTAERRDGRDKLPSVQVFGDLPHALRVRAGEGWQPVAGATDSTYAYGSDGKALVRAFTDASRCDLNMTSLEHLCTVQVDVQTATSWRPLPSVLLPSTYLVSPSVVLSVETDGEGIFVRSTAATAAWNGKRWAVLDRTGGWPTSAGIFRLRSLSILPPRYAIELWNLKASRWRQIGRSNYRFGFGHVRRTPFTLIGIETSGGLSPFLLQLQNGVLEERPPPSPSPPQAATDLVPPHGKLDTDALWSGDRAVVLAVIYQAPEFHGGKAFAEPHVWEWAGQSWRELGPWDP